VDFCGVDGVGSVVLESVPHFVIFCSSKVGRSFFEKLTMDTYLFEEQSGNDESILQSIIISHNNL
jgi:hypothetical protein